MDELKRRILDDAIVGEGDIIHVDMFLNHCMDMELMERMGNELARRFKGEKVSKVLTAESSGIAIACFTALALDVPAVYAKKFQTGYRDADVYAACHRIHDVLLTEIAERPGSENRCGDGDRRGRPSPYRRAGSWRRGGRAAGYSTRRMEGSPVTKSSWQTASTVSRSVTSSVRWVTRRSCWSSPE